VHSSLEAESFVVSALSSELRLRKEKLFVVEVAKATRSKMGKKPRSLRRPNGGRFSKCVKKCGSSATPDTLLVTAAVPEPVLRPCPLPPTPRLLAADTLLAIAKGETAAPFGFDELRTRHDTTQMQVSRHSLREAMMTSSGRCAVSVSTSALRELAIEDRDSRSLWVPASAARMCALCELARGEAVAPGCEIIMWHTWGTY
jgi:hypothetical protein